MQTSYRFLLAKPESSTVKGHPHPAIHHPLSSHSSWLLPFAKWACP